MRPEGISLASGEEVVRRYDCTATDSVLELAGLVLPLPRRRSRDGTVTLTDRRLMFDLEAGTRRDGSSKGVLHQEVLLSDVASVSASLSRARSSPALPILLIVIGLALMLVPYAVALSDGTLDSDRDYVEGYNDGREAGYYEGYLYVAQQPTILFKAEIPEDYRPVTRQTDASADYDRGYDEGHAETYETGVYDATLGRAFTVPEKVAAEDDPWPDIMAAAWTGAVFAVFGSLLYSFSLLSRDWASIRLGSSRGGVYIMSVSGGWPSSSDRGMTPSGGYEEMVRDLGAAVLEIRDRAGRSTAVRVVEEEVPEEPRQLGMVDRGEEGGVDEARPDLYGDEGIDSGIVFGGGPEDRP